MSFSDSDLVKQGINSKTMRKTSLDFEKKNKLNRYFIKQTYYLMYKKSATHNEQFSMHDIAQLYIMHDLGKIHSLINSTKVNKTFINFR